MASIDRQGNLHDTMGLYTTKPQASAAYDLTSPTRSQSSAVKARSEKAVDWSDPADIEHLRTLLKVAAGISRDLGRNIGGTDWSSDLEAILGEEIVKASHQPDGTNGVRKISPAWVRKVGTNIRSSALDMVRQGRTPEDYVRVNKSTVRAWNRLRAERADYYAQHGHEMPPAVVDARAAAIRESFPPGKRPPVGFHDSRVSGKVTRGIDESSNTEANAPGMYADYVPSAESRALADDTADVDIEALADPQAKRGKWLATAKVMGMDFSAEGTLTEDHAKELRKMVGSTDADVMAVLDDWWDGGHESQKAASILAAAFGARSQTQQRQVVNLIEAHPTMAQTFFNAAVTDATIRRK